MRWSNYNGKRVLCILFCFIFFMGSSVPIKGESRYVTPKKPKISQEKIYMCKGERIALKLKNTKKRGKWKSSNKKVAVVTNKGMVKAKKTGKAKITARLGKRTYFCTVFVEKMPVITYNNPVFTKELYKKIDWISTYLTESHGIRKRIKSKVGIASVYSILAGAELVDITDKKEEDMIGGVGVFLYLKDGTRRSYAVGFQVRTTNVVYSTKDANLGDQVANRIRKYLVDPV